MPKPENIKGKGFDKHPENINKKGRPPVLPELKEIIARVLSEEKNGMNGLEALIRSLLISGVKGNTRAAQELLDRGFGKSQQLIELAAKDIQITGITFDDTD